MRLFLFVSVLLSVADELRALEVCYPDLGCFSDDPPYNGLLLPQCSSLGLIMKLYTRENPLEGEEFSRTMFPTSFKPFKTLLLIVHGWLQSGLAEWMHDMKDAVLKKSDYNVVIVGWQGGSENLDYCQSAADTRCVGAEIALFAKLLIEKGLLSREKLYCVGHSLGAQICGQAGNRLKFGRITGLDPAAPLFEDREFELNSSCADFVDVIHTHGLLYAGILRIGDMKAIGHVDFYPNGGQTQPGCDLCDITFDPVDILTSATINDMLTKIFGVAGPVCNHMRAVYIFIESILTPCFVARYWCYDQYIVPLFCSWSIVNTQNMGFSASPSGPRGIFYLTTNGKSPYCKG